METNIFIKNNIEKIRRGEYTDFLNISERNKIISILNKLHIKYNEFIPFDGANKVIIYTEVYPDVCLIEFVSSSNLKHSDILGMLFSNNISPTKYGDIIIDCDRYYLVTFVNIKYYLINNIINIKNSLVHVKEVSIDTINNYSYDYEELNILVTSLRLDNIVSSLTHNSRKNVDSLFKDKYVLVNYELINKKTYTLKDNDVISIRGHGKYIFESIVKKTNKDKYIIKILKYK